MISSTTVLSCNYKFTLQEHRKIMYSETSSYCLSARYYTALQEQLTIAVLKSKFQRHSHVVEDMLRCCQNFDINYFRRLHCNTFGQIKHSSGKGTPSGRAFKEP